MAYRIIPRAEKACSRCSVPKPFGEFYRESRSPDGRRAECKDCTRSHRKAADFGSYQSRWQKLNRDREVWLHHSVSPARDDAGAIRDLEKIGESRFGRGISYTFLVTVGGYISFHLEGTGVSGGSLDWNLTSYGADDFDPEVVLLSGTEALPSISVDGEYDLVVTDPVYVGLGAHPNGVSFTVDAATYLRVEEG